MRPTSPAASSSHTSAWPGEIASSQQRWRESRAWLNQHRWELAQSASRLYPTALRVAETALLAKPLWLPSSPIAIEQIGLTWRDEKIDWPVRGDEPAPFDVRAVDDHGVPFPRYSDAMRKLSPPKIFDNRACYGLRELNATNAQMVFGPAEYFANIDTGEAVAHEYALAVQQSPMPCMTDLPYRDLVGDPLDFARRPIPVAISTLVLRRDTASGETHMLLHWRDPHKVASGGGLFQVAPVGVFQPSHDAPWNHHNDFDLWRSIQREMSEELLGTSEDYASSTEPIDYAAWTFARALDQARQDGRIRAAWLGAGIDPLTLVCDLLCCVTIDAAIFDSVFATLVHHNDEGHLITGEDATGRTVGIPFTRESIDRFSQQEPMQPAGAALLRLAWQHRSHLLRH